MSPPPTSSSGPLERSPSSRPVLSVVGHDRIIRPIGTVRKGTAGSHTDAQCLRLHYARRFSAAIAALGWSKDETARQLQMSRRWCLDFSKGRAKLTEEAMDITEMMESLVQRGRTGT